MPVTRSIEQQSVTLQKFDQKLAITYRISLAYSHTVFQYEMIDVALRKRSFFAEILSAFLKLNLARDQQFKVKMKITLLVRIN